jgi:uncharacterized protein YlxP (DUF503 family)
VNASNGSSERLKRSVAEVDAAEVHQREVAAVVDVEVEVQVVRHHAEAKHALIERA